MVRAAFEDVASEDDLAVRLRQSRSLLEEANRIGRDILDRAIWEARIDGHTWAAIARAAGYSDTGGDRLVRDRAVRYGDRNGLKVPRRRPNRRETPVQAFDARIRGQRETEPQGAIRSPHRG